MPLTDLITDFTQQKPLFLVTITINSLAERHHPKNRGNLDADASTKAGSATLMVNLSYSMHIPCKAYLKFL